MLRPCRRRPRILPMCRAAACLGAWLSVAACAAWSLPDQAQTPAQNQDPATAPVSIPAGAQSAQASAAAARPAPAVSEKQARAADDAYLSGAKAMERDDLAAAEQDFGRAVQLNPARPEYLLSLTVAREHRVSALVTQAAVARRAGNTTLADTLLAQARALDPDSPIVAQHFQAAPAASFPIVTPTVVAAADLPGSGTFQRLGGPIELNPAAGVHSFHQSAAAEQMLHDVYSAYGIRIQLPTPLANGRTVRLDLDDVDYATATHALDKMLNVFAVPVQPDFALVVVNTQESRQQYEPLVEETLYLPGLSGDALSELANVARQVFDLQQVTASQTAGDMLVRGSPKTLRLLNAVYADMLDGGSDVQVDIALYEIDKNHTRNFGVQTPSSVGAYSFYSEAESLINANQTVIQTAVSSGLITLTGVLSHDLPLEIGVLEAAGLLNISQITGLLGTLGTFNGVPLVGVFLGSGTTLNLAFNSTDVRTLDFAQLRAGDHQAASFRAGTRYPVITGTYSSGISSSALSGLTAAQQQLAQQYLGSSTSVSIPQFQYEDLGLTLKATPTIHQGRDVTLVLDMKLEALGGTSLNNVPILNSRALTSTVTVPSGQTVLLASEVTKSEMRAINGIPGLSEIPGFEGTDKDAEKDTAELLITLTPHIVRVGHREASSRRLAYDHAAGAP